MGAQHQPRLIRLWLMLFSDKPFERLGRFELFEPSSLQGWGRSG
jgi:hypothetical protein